MLEKGYYSKNESLRIDIYKEAVKRDIAIWGKEEAALKEEYDALAPEYDLIQALIDARKSQNLTQKELSERTGITQADISRIENGTRNPSLNMIKRLADGMGMVLKLEFIKAENIK